MTCEPLMLNFDAAALKEIELSTLPAGASLTLFVFVFPVKMRSETVGSEVGVSVLGIQLVGPGDAGVSQVLLNKPVQVSTVA